MKTDGIIIASEYIDGLRKLPKADLGDLIMAVLDCVSGEEPNLESDSIAVEILYPVLQASVDRTRDKSEKMSDAGKLGGRPKKTENEKAELSEEKSQAFESEKAKLSENEKPVRYGTVRTDSTDSTEKEKAPTGPKRKAAPFEELFADAPDLNQDFVCEAWEAWKEVRRRKKAPWTADAAVLSAKNLKKLSRGDPIRAVKILEQSTERGWQGLFELKEQTSKGKALDWDSVVV